MKIHDLFAGITSPFTDFYSAMIVPVLPLFLTAGGVGVIEGSAELTSVVLKLFSRWIFCQIGRLNRS